ncbi:MAG TPA: hypothetical protein DCR93_22760 [Cytophagales bacterium]|nr:hypothetical protein [Cytophagales bacterium]HAP62197.1 hypothetical protein [Cytophagales bacterium]
MKSVFNDNETNVHYYDIVNTSFHGKVVEIAFAQPILQPLKGEIIWKTPIPGPYQVYFSAEEQTRSQLESTLQAGLDKMEQILANHPDKDFLDNIIEIPDEKALFYVEQEDGYKIIFTEWGFIKDQHTRSQSILKRMLPGTQKSFILRIVSGTEQPLSGVSCHFATEAMQQDAVSDAEGTIRLNNLERGSTLTITSPDGVFETQELELDAVEEHTLRIERVFTLSFDVKDSQGQPVSHTSFTYSSPGQPDRALISDEAGLFQTKQVEAEGDFTILSSQGEELLNTQIPTEDATYSLVYDPPVAEVPQPSIPTPIPSDALPVEIQFLDQQKAPLKGQTVRIEQAGASRTFTTNEDGIIQVDDLTPNAEHTLTLTYQGSDWVKTFFHPQGQQRHTFVVEENHGPITLEFLNRRKKPIANQAIQVFGLPNNNSFITDKDGLVTLDALYSDTAYCAFMRYKKADWKEDFTHTGETKYQFIVKHRRFLWWWIPAVLLFFFLLSLIPTQVRHRYTVLDNYTKQPLANAFIQNNQASIFQTLQTGTQTDSDGKLSVAYGRYPIYKQIFGEPKANVTASKAGYENLTESVPLGFFKTRRSNFYLGVPAPPAPIPIPIQGCNSGGDNGSHSSLIQYDLKQNQGQFLLNYDLYSHPDEIRVYNCISSEIWDHQPIFQYRGREGNPTLIRFNNGPHITVWVLSPEGDSAWEYWVNCPQ